MIRIARPGLFIGLAILMMVVGLVLIFAMVVGAVQPTFLLSFVGYALSFAGFVVGLLGIAFR